MTTTLSVGKIRGLQQCATINGAFVVLALDRRAGLSEALDPQVPGSVTPNQISSFRQRVITTLFPALGRVSVPTPSAMLIPLEVVAPQCIVSGILPGSIGFVAAIEGKDSTAKPSAHSSRASTGQIIEKARRMGASAVWLSIAYCSEPSFTAQVKEQVGQVAEHCTDQGLPLFLGISTLPSKLTEGTIPPKQSCRMMIESVRQLVMPGVDVLSVELPPTTNLESDESEWADACAELSGTVPVPWILNSSGVEYGAYLRKLITACKAGASGTAADQTVWQDAVELSKEGHLAVFQSVTCERIAEIVAVCDVSARPWTDLHRLSGVKSK